MANEAASTNSFGDLLKFYRSRTGLTQEDLAEKAGLSWRGISDLERGARRSPQKTTLRLLIKALALSAAEAAGFEAAARSVRASGVVEPARPAARSAESPRTLPLPATPLIGREQELQEITGRFQHQGVRLLTLCGPGGVGKTRLALEAAHALRGWMRDGVRFVPLETLTRAQDVLPALSAGLGLADRGNQPLLTVIADYLEEREMLLVLDNMEHLVEAAPELAALLTRCAGLRLLVTSRAPLELRAEHIIDVEPLLVPPPPVRDDPALYAATLTPALASTYSAVTLFLDRAQAVSSAFELTAQNTEHVAVICRELDGLPLALELAAARVRSMSPERIAGQLDQRLALLSSGPRDLPSRHQSLRAVLDWSHDLLAAEERVLLRRLSVFSGGWTVEAAVEVCAPVASYGLPVEALELLLHELVRQSLVVADERDGRRRYRLLETVREYAALHLRQAGEAEALATRHFAWCLAVSQRPRPERTGPEQQQWRTALAAELPNMRAALLWCDGQGRRRDLLALCAALGPLWRDEGLLREGHRWLARATELSTGDESAAMADAEYYAGRLAWEMPDLEEAGRRADESARLAAALSDCPRRARALTLLGRVEGMRGDFEQALTLLREALGICQRCNDWRGAVEALNRIAFTSQQMREFDDASAAAGESLKLSQDNDDELGAFDALWNLAAVASAQRRFQIAEQLSHQALAVARAGGWERNVADALSFLGAMQNRRERHEEAIACFQDAIAIYAQRGARLGVLNCLLGLVQALAAVGEGQRAAFLVGAIDRMQRQLEEQQARSSGQVAMRTITAIQQVLDPAEAEAWIARGRLASFRETVREALYERA